MTQMLGRIRIRGRISRNSPQSRVRQPYRSKRPGPVTRWTRPCRPNRTKIRTRRQMFTQETQTWARTTTVPENEVHGLVFVFFVVICTWLVSVCVFCKRQMHGCRPKGSTYPSSRILKYAWRFLVSTSIFRASCRLKCRHNHDILSIKLTLNVRTILGTTQQIMMCLRLSQVKSCHTD